jgi:signal transduction histidine kinase
MKLLTKTTLYFLLVIVPLLAATGFFLFHQFSREIDHRDDRELIHDEIQWIRYLESITGNGANFILRSPYILIYPVRKPVSQYPSITDTYNIDEKNNLRIPFRQLSHVVPVNGTPYQIVIRKSQEQKTALVANITWIMFLVFVGLSIATLVFNWLISKNLWRPFKASLQKVRNIELHKLESIHFDETNTEEFNELNAALNSMSHKIYDDYVNMKEFTENAAHEMQTPLAVVQSKLELLLQDPNLEERQVEAIMQASSALSRLGKLNQSLLLLARIENNQYETSEQMNLVDTTRKYLQLFDELIKDKQLKVHTELHEDFLASLHPHLADSLISNLLGNAIKYNYNGGEISIIVKNNYYCITNTSLLPVIDPQRLFKRFNRSAYNSDTSNGLGLAIVKKICDTYQISIDYKAENSKHEFCLNNTKST